MENNAPHIRYEEKYFGEILGQRFPSDKRYGKAMRRGLTTLFMKKIETCYHIPPKYGLNGNVEQALNADKKGKKKKERKSKTTYGFFHQKHGYIVNYKEVARTFNMYPDCLFYI